MKVKAQRKRIAAFFDIDGTLLRPPSLEWRLFTALRDQRAVSMQNYFLWLARAARLTLRGVSAVCNENKVYLRGVRVKEAETRIGQGAAGARAVIYREGVERIAWHVRQGHAIVLVSGTLAPLAHSVAAKIAMQLAFRGLSGSIHVCATQLEEAEGQWTGEILGDAVVGEAKARAVRHFAAENGLELGQSYAYGDSMSDRWMLEALGRPLAVNPSQELHRLARAKDWPIFWWRETQPTATAHREQKTPRREHKILENLG